MRERVALQCARDKRESVHRGLKGTVVKVRRGHGCGKQCGEKEKGKQIRKRGPEGFARELAGWKTASEARLCWVKGTGARLGGEG